MGIRSEKVKKSTARLLNKPGITLRISVLLELAHGGHAAHGRTASALLVEQHLEHLRVGRHLVPLRLRIVGRMLDRFRGRLGSARSGVTQGSGRDTFRYAS